MCAKLLIVESHAAAAQIGRQLRGGCKQDGVEPGGQGGRLLDIVADVQRGDPGAPLNRITLDGDIQSLPI